MWSQAFLRICHIMLNLLLKVLRELWGGTMSNQKTFFIGKFKNRICQFAPIYDNGEHEDCFEFFIFLFNAISDDCSSELPRQMMTESEKAWYGHLQGRSSFWIDSFYFQLRNLKICCNCRKVNPTYDTDSLLMLSVPNKSCNLQNMIFDYLKEVRLTDFSCNNCKFTNTIINKKELTVEPEILAIVLKRYMPSSDNLTFVKNMAEIDFPLRDLRFGTSSYNLCSIVEHSGNLSGGHYFATVKLDYKSDDWYLFNDTVISKYSKPVNGDARIKTSAAGFFYVRNSM
uniref:ubiquitinyl hydrolase 1 n=1 Tax=Diabrotica virgifera virgifera TaxID=50390 RepID=A0A6P7GT98_DIAVI